MYNVKLQLIVIYFRARRTTRDHRERGPGIFLDHVETSFRPLYISPFTCDRTGRCIQVRYEGIEKGPGTW